jgi:N-acetylmuramoyl-L-alanine amidase
VVRWPARAAVLALACAGLTAGCGLLGSPQNGSGASVGPGPPAGSATTGASGASIGSDPTAGSETPAVTSPAAPTPSGLATSAPDVPPRASLRGKVVVIDPGHNGANSQHTRTIAAKVDIGNGTKACDTTGAETNAGYPESAFTFDVASRLATQLRAQGATVVLTRPDNRGVGPCITERAATGNRWHADAAISIHGDGADADERGFHVILPAGIGTNDAIVAPSRRLGVRIRDAFRAGSGEPLSTYIGTRTGGLVTRSDLGGLNLSAVPKVLIECGNMRNATDARRMTSPTWRQRAATALAAGLTRYLTGR